MTREQQIQHEKDREAERQREAEEAAIYEEVRSRHHG